MAILETVTFTNTTASPVALNGFVTDGGFTFTSGTNNLTVAVEDYAGRAIPGSNVWDYAFIGDLAPTTADYSVKCDLLVRDIGDFHEASIWARVTGTVGNTGYEARVDANSNVINLWAKTAGSGGAITTSYSLVGTSYDLASVTSGSPVLLPLELRAVGDQVSVYLDGTLILGPVTDTTHTAAGTVGISMRSAGADEYRFDNLVIESLASATVDYTIRKGATAVPITHTLTAGGITSQTFNGETVALASQSGQIANVDFTDTITTSGVYTLTLGDGATTQNFDVQYNVIGLTSDQLLKDGAAQASLSDLELIVLTGAEGSRAVPEQESSLTTDASGNTGQTILNDTGIVDATAVFVIWNSASADTRWAYPTTAGLL